MGSRKAQSLLRVKEPTVLVVGKDLVDSLPHVLAASSPWAVSRLPKLLQHRLSPGLITLLYQLDAAPIDPARRLYDEPKDRATGEDFPYPQRHVLNRQALGLDRLVDRVGL